jgi:RNA polymerase sigma-B factor
VRTYLVSRPRRPSAWMPDGAVAALARGLASAGVDVVSDVEPVRRPGPAGAASRRPQSADFQVAVRACAADLTERWRHVRPDLVHAFGYVATVAAVRVAGPGIPVVATFYQSPPWDGLERWLARRVDGLVVASTAERDRWRQAGVGTEHVRAIAPAIEEPPGPAEPAGTGPVVVTDATGPELSSLVTSMRFWPEQTRLVVLDCGSARRIAAVSAQAEELSVLDRIEWRPSPSAALVAAQFSDVHLAVACDSARHGGLVTQAAARGVPAVAVDQDAHSDLVVSKATGLLVGERPGPVLLGEAVRHVLTDPLLSHGYGSAAQVRVRAVQSPEAVADRVLAAYTDVLESASNPPAVPEPERPEPGLDQVARDRLATEYLPLAHQLARRYAGRGQPLEDLVQVASLGLVKAANRFDPEQGTSFPSYAVPTMLGEIRRHFRDHAWAVRVPRTLQETTLQVDKTTERLNQQHGEATTEQVAAELGLTDLEVIEARQTRGEAFTQASLDHPVGEDGDGSLGDLVGGEDESLQIVEEQVAVREALRRLPERERQILTMRFFGEHTQMEIAEELGLSQVHVSRTLSRTLSALRDHVLDEAPLPHRWVGDESASPPSASGIPAGDGT